MTQALSGTSMTGMLAPTPAERRILVRFGEALLADGDAAGAASIAKALIKRVPRHLPTLYLLQRACTELEQPGLALVAVQQALASTPAPASLARGKQRERHRAAMFELEAQILMELGRVQAARGALSRALQLNPASVSAKTMLGELLCRSPARPKGIALLRAALQQQPDNLRALVQLGETLHLTEAQNESIACLDRALRVHPDEPVATILSVAGRIVSARIDEEAITKQRLLRFLDIDTTPLYAAKAAYWAAWVDMPLSFERRAWAKVGAAVQGVLAPMQVGPFVHTGRRHQRIRIGYVSPALGNHPMGHVTRPIYAAHDRSRFEVSLYPTTDRSEDNSVYKHDILAGCDRVRSLVGMRSADMAQAIHADEIDILIDLNGYMGVTDIIETCALRPAPLQLYWLGHGGGMGLPYYDYIIGDPVASPPEHDDHYDDAVLRLPHCSHVFVPPAEDAVPQTPPSRADEGLADDAFVFCAFNNPGKISAEVFDLWLQILAAVPNSQLWLSRGRSAAVSDNLRRLATCAGIDGERLVFARRIPEKGLHFARHQLADLFLDTFNVTAATTCLDALWSGLPVLTRPGRHFCARLGASMVHTAGLDELIVDSAAQYRETAIALANDSERLAKLREKVVAARHHSPLFDLQRFMWGLDAGLEAIWERHRTGKPPISMTIADEAPSPIAL